MKRKKIIAAAVCIALVCVLIITAAAAKYVFVSSDLEVTQQTVNRVNITVSDTEFLFGDVDSDGELLCRTTVTIEKTEPDFYGVLDSITLSGQDFGYTIYTAGADNGDAVLPEDAVLPCGDDGTYPLEWEIAFTVPYEEGTNEYAVSIDFVYTTGIKTNVTQQYKTSIPVMITVE